MNPERARELWSQFIAGPGLPGNLERELTDALRRDEALREALLEDVEVDGLLRVLERPGADAEAFSRAFFDCLAAEEDKSRFIRKVESRIDSEGTARGSRRIARVRLQRQARRAGPALFLALSAAGALFAIVLVSALNVEPRPTGTAHRPRPRPEREAPPEEAPEPPRRERPVPAPIEPDPPRPQDAPRVELPQKPEPPTRVPVPDRAPETEKPNPPPAPGPEAPKPPTASAIALLERAEGEVVIGANRTPARAGSPVPPGQSVQTGGGASLALLTLEDETKLELGAASAIAGITERRNAGKLIDLARGELEARVKRQPIGRSMVITTPHGKVTVLGTTLRVTVEPAKTRLEVEEGKVTFEAFNSKRVIGLTDGQFAEAGAGVEFAARTIPIDDILLLPGQGKPAGNDWQLVQDPNASTGCALEVKDDLARSQMRLPAPVLRQIPSHVEFRFKAQANRDYYVWIRGHAPTPKGPPALRDAVIIELPQGAQVTQSGITMSSGGPLSAEFNGYMARAGYWWLGGYDDGNPPGDTPPVKVRFPRTGEFALRLYAWESPIRIDALWFSTTQKTRPADNYPGPQTRKK